MRSKQYVVVAALALPLLFIHTLTPAQSCLPGGITIDKQSQIDSFAINYPGCVSVLGHMLIFPSTPGSITSLSGLSQITSVGGDLWINDNTTALTSFTGLNGVTAVGGHLRIRYNSGVLSLSGLNGIATVGGELDISYNPNLENVNGLNSLTSAGGNCIISNNGHLVSLTGLSNFSAIGGYLSISVDTSLTSLVGLDSIDHTTITNLQISNCKVLTKCNIKSLCDYLGIASNPAAIGGNGAGCATRLQIENACAAQTGIGETLAGGYRVYPNPAGDYVVIEGDGLLNARITIADAKGKLLKDCAPGNGVVDIAGLAGGIYFVSIQTNRFVSVKKIIKAGQ